MLDIQDIHERKKDIQDIPERKKDIFQKNKIQAITLHRKEIHTIHYEYTTKKITPFY